MSAIEIKILKKYFGKTKAIDGINLSIKKGEVFGFLGPNGAGKTTTIRCMMDFLRPTEGEVTILGKDSKKDSVAIKSQVGFLSGDVTLYPNMTGEEHFDIVESINGRSKILADLTKRLGFNPKVKFKNLSSGNKQKMGLILALMKEPEVLILDEPTVGLDPLLQNEIYEILREFKEKGTTIFISSHNLPEVEKICDRVGIIKQGQIIATEDIKNLKAKMLYRVHVTFDGKFDKKDFEGPDTEIIEDLEETITISVKKDIDKVIKNLSKYKVKDLEVHHASLEDIFMEFYK